MEIIIKILKYFFIICVIQFVATGVLATFDIIWELIPIWSVALLVVGGIGSTLILSFLIEMTS